MGFQQYMNDVCGKKYTKIDIQMPVNKIINPKSIYTAEGEILSKDTIAQSRLEAQTTGRLANKTSKSRQFNSMMSKMLFDPIDKN